MQQIIVEFILRFFPRVLNILFIDDYALKYIIYLIIFLFFWSFIIFLLLLNILIRSWFVWWYWRSTLLFLAIASLFYKQIIIFVHIFILFWLNHCITFLSFLLLSFYYFISFICLDFFLVWFCIIIITINSLRSLIVLKRLSSVLFIYCRLHFLFWKRIINII